MTNVGPDPIAWLQRLRDVNAESAFTLEERTVIDTGLRALERSVREEQRRVVRAPDPTCEHCKDRPGLVWVDHHGYDTCQCVRASIAANPPPFKTADTLRLEIEDPS
jgi:hypothetical protein